METSADAIHKSSDEINPDQMYVKKKSEYNVKITSDKRQTCYISGISILPSGVTIVADYANKRVKMLDKHYNVSSDLEVDGNPQDICQISHCQVAVTFDKEVKFIYVNEGKLMTGENPLRVGALGITNHQDDLYVTSGIALYNYTLAGSYWKLNKCIYEDTGGGFTVYKCACSPDGNWIYVTNFVQNKLITLAIDGTLISTFTDPELQGPKGLHVTPTGQVLVCSINSHTVLQVDLERKKKMTTLASEKDGISYPVSICYNTNSRQIIVGAYANNKISVMEL